MKTGKIILRKTDKKFSIDIGFNWWEVENFVKNLNIFTEKTSLGYITNFLQEFFNGFCKEKFWINIKSCLVDVKNSSICYEISSLNLNKNDLKQITTDLLCVEKMMIGFRNIISDWWLDLENKDEEFYKIIEKTSDVIKRMKNK